MNAYITRVLRELLSDLEPRHQQRAIASQCQRTIREILNEGRFGRRVIRSYLTGSYARHTAIRPMDDVDIIFEIEPTAWGVPLLRSLPDPDALIKSFASAIRRRYSGGSVRRQRRSVCLRLPDINIDIVPAVVDDADDPEVIRIPDRDDVRWLYSAPKRHAVWATEANRRCKRTAKPLIKLLKFWNSELPSTTATKSFIIETIAVRLFLESPVKDLIEGLLEFWDFLASVGGEDCEFEWKEDFGVSRTLFRGFVVNDTAELSGNVAAGMSQDHLRRLARHSRYARQHLTAALRARSEESAHARLEKIFGEL